MFLESVSLPKTRPYRLAMWDITYQCNFKCHHCYNEEKVNQSQQKQPLSLFDALYIIDQLASDGFDEINLAGGEPLLVPHLPELIERGMQRGITMSINTNGWYLSPRLAEHLLALGCTRVAFSLAGLKEVTNALVRGPNVFKTVEKNIHYFANRIVQMGQSNQTSINWSVTTWNIAEFPNLYSFCLDLGVSTASVHLTQRMGAAFDYSHLVEGDSEKILDGFENLIRNWGPEVSLILDTRPASSYYLNQKYLGVRKIVEANCYGGDRNIYIQPDGIRLACKLQVLHKGVSSSANILREFGEGAFVNWKARLEKPHFCAGCPFRNICTPCPLIERSEMPEECKVALSRQTAYQTMLLDRPLHKAFGVETSLTDGKLTLSLNGHRYGLSESGWQIWNAMTEGITMRNLILKDRASKEELKNIELYDFIQNLREKGLINLTDDHNSRWPIHFMQICCAR